MRLLGDPVLVMYRTVAGSVLDQCWREAFSKSLEFETPVQFTHNARVFVVSAEEIMMHALGVQERRLNAEQEEKR